MIDGIRLKVCGLTSIVDAECADRCGADYLGFILYPKSPRYVAMAQYRAMAPRLPERRKVAVTVEPTAAELTAIRDAGFDFFQIHFQLEIGAQRLEEWVQAVGRDRLWLAPKLPPAVDVPAAMAPAAKFILLDTFHAEGFGGSGKTGDWGKFARHQAAYPENFWILAGGLSAENIGAALAGTGARWVDVNSGVESAPGVKDEGKLKRFVTALRQAATKRG
jgi:phosphoribosylanthranilate isomerase